MTQDRTLIDKIKNSAIRLIETHNGIKHDDLYVKLLAEYLNAKSDELLLALSEMAQDGLAQRFEYTNPRKGYHYHYFYLPYDARVS